MFRIDRLLKIASVYRIRRALREQQRGAPAGDNAWISEYRAMRRILAEFGAGIDEPVPNSFDGRMAIDQPMRRARLISVS